MIIRLLFLFILSFNALSQEELEIESFCKGDKVKIGDSEYKIVDNGFCKALEEIKIANETIDKDLILDIDHSLNIITENNLTAACSQLLPSDQNYTVRDPLKKPKFNWKIRFYATHSFTTYFDTDMKFRSSRYNVDIKDYTWTERSSREFFNPETWKKEGNNPFQMIDEPTNTFILSLEKDGHEFFLSAFHPKFLQTDQTKYMKGTIDGVEVDGIAPINRPFDGYNQAPGEMELVRNQNTHLQMIFEIGYGHRFKLFEGKAGSLVYTPSIGIGVTTGGNYTVVIKEDEWWEFDDYSDKFKVQGFGGNISNRLEYNIPGERFGLVYENKLGFYHQKHGFMDGTQEYNLKFMGNSIGFKFLIYKPKKSGSKAALSN